MDFFPIYNLQTFINSFLGQCPYQLQYQPAMSMRPNTPQAAQMTFIVFGQSQDQSWNIQSLLKGIFRFFKAL
jgi:hypothetical protein